MKRIDIRCCCTPYKLLGTVPVPGYLMRSPRVTLPLIGVPDLRIAAGSIDFEVASWTDTRVVVDERGKLDRCTEGGIALRRDGVTVEILRRIPGFIEATHE